MRKHLIPLLVLALILAACTAAPQEPASDVLKVSNGTIEKSYNTDDLKTLGQTQATVDDVTYIGVSLTVLLRDAGIDPGTLTAVKAVAVDGFTANYEAALYNREDTIVAYARVDGPLGADEMPFRMVLPDQGGKLNPRQLVEVIAIP